MKSAAAMMSSVHKGVGGLEEQRCAGVKGKRAYVNRHIGGCWHEVMRQLRQFNPNAQ